MTTTKILSGLFALGLAALGALEAYVFLSAAAC